MNLKLLSLFLLLLSATAAAATVAGTTYDWSTLKPLKFTVVEINTQPKQVFVSEDGRYSFSVADGNYSLKALYFEDSRLKYAAAESLHIINDGNFTVDLIMLPSFDENDYLTNDLNELGVQMDTGQQEKPSEWLPIALAIILAAFLFWRLYWNKQTPTNSGQTEGAGPVTVPASGTKPDAELESILSELRRYGNRMTQKELREKTGIGEAKLSLILTQLEHEGRIRKFRSGRGNVVVLSR